MKTVKYEWMKCLLGTARSVLAHTCFSLLVFTSPAPAEEAPDFVPPVEFRTIHFPEAGGGPLKVYEAAGFGKVATLVETAEFRLIWTQAKPPTTATTTMVTGIFILTGKTPDIHILDSLRFQSAGKYADSKIELTNGERGETHFTVSLSQGGRGESYQQSASYKVKEGKFVLDTPVNTNSAH